MGPLGRAWRRHISGYEDYIELTDDYLNSLQSNDVPSVVGLLKYIPKDKNRIIVLVLINAFGLIESPRIVKIHGIAQDILDAYKTNLKNNLSDFLLTLKNHLEELRTGKLQPNYSPEDVNYSWQQESYFNPLLPMDSIRHGLGKSLLALPFPYQTARMLGIDDLPCLNDLLQEYLGRLKQMSSKIFSALEHQTRLNAGYQNQRDAFLGEQLLIKQGASLAYPKVISYIEELQTWAKVTKQVEKIRNIFADLKLVHLLNGLVKPPLAKHSTLPSDSVRRHQTHVKRDARHRVVPPEVFQDSIPSSSSSSSQEENSLASLVPFLIAPISFQEYLILKTTKRCISPLCYLHPALKEKSTQLFQNEFFRIDFIFFVQTVNSLFLNVEEKPFLRDMIQCVYPLEKYSDPQERVFHLAKQLFKAANAEELAFVQMYIFIFLVKIRLRNELPVNCMNQLPVDDAKTIFCIYDLLCLYSQKIELLDEYLLDLGKKLFSYEMITNRASPVQLILFDQGTALLEKHEFYPGDPEHDLINTILHFINCKFYMDMSPDVQSFLFDRLQKATPEDRFQCALEMKKFIRSLKKETRLEHHEPRLMRHELLKQAAAKKKIYTQSEDAIPEMMKVLEKIIHSEAYRLFIMEFHVDFMKQVEDLIGSPLPLMTILVLLLYCPSLCITLKGFQGPILFNAIRELSNQNKAHNFDQETSLFIPPSIIKKIGDLLATFIDPSTSISSQCYPNRHAYCLELHLRPIVAIAQERLIPALPFREIIVEQAKTFFSTKDISRHSLQNHIHRTTGDLFEGEYYIGEWLSLVYMLQWKLEFDESTNEVRPFLEIVLWRSFYDLVSREFQVKLDLAEKDLSEDLCSLLNTMLLSFGEEIQDVEYEEPIMALSNVKQELEFCLNLYQPFKEEWSEFLEKKQDGERIGLALFEFVKQLKITVRREQALLFKSDKSNDSQNQSMAQVLIPNLSEVSKEICEDCVQNGTAKEYEISQLETEKGKWSFSTCYDPESFHQFTTHLAYEGINDSLRLQHSFKLGTFMNHPSVPNLLEWQLKHLCEQ